MDAVGVYGALAWGVGFVVLGAWVVGFCGGHD